MRTAGKKRIKVERGRAITEKLENIFVQQSEACKANKISALSPQ
jgi:hypothetical protein